ncbi:PREDICTED: F-box/kelch-repeat protein At3g13680-like [Camelina sativa]|uniref:F-box/kelch-repeat protein At3g13680-like n=1 Tax=Camelina sativa TaxID=90675 RepID=A0ABM0SKR2_CAMSA|nr:PREDICTED: F-box/kelch-repeat protein At3g13680-like [Camelina sativa]
MDYRVCSVRFNLNGIQNEEYLVDISIKQVALLDQVKISKLFHCDGLLLCVVKDNAGLLRIKVSGGEGGRRKIEDSLLCFDFISERFGPRLPLPLQFHSYRSQTLTLSCVGEEKLAVFIYLRSISSVYEFWVTNKIDPNAVSWSKFLRSFRGSDVVIGAGRFFIDEEEKVAVVFDLDYKYKQTRYQTARIFGEGGYYKSADFGEAPNLSKPDKSYMLEYVWKEYCYPVVCSSYVPSLVQLHINQPGKRKIRDY